MANNKVLTDSQRKARKELEEKRKQQQKATDMGGAQVQANTRQTTSSQTTTRQQTSRPQTQTRRNNDGTWRQQTSVTGSYFGNGRRNNTQTQRTGSGRTVSQTYNYMDAVNPTVANQQRESQKKQQQQQQGYRTNQQRANTLTSSEKSEINNIASDKTFKARKALEKTQKRNDEINSTWDKWESVAKHVTFNSEQEYADAVEKGKASNILRKGNYGLDENTLTYFDSLYGSNKGDLANEGANLIIESKTVSNNLKTQSNVVQKASLKENQRISNDFTAKAKETQQRIDDINSGKIKVDNKNWEIAHLNKLRATYEQNARDYQQFANYDKDVSGNAYEMSRDKNAALTISKGKQQDEFLMDRRNPDFGKVVQGLMVSSDEDAIRTAALTMTDEERDLYYWTVGEKGQQAGIDYLKQIYEHGRSDGEGNTFGGLGARTADIIGKETNNPVYNTAQAFSAGAQNAIFGLRDFGERVASGFAEAQTGAKIDPTVHVDGLMNKIYRENVETGRLNKIVGDIAYNVGNMMPAIAVSVATGGIGSPMMGGTVAAGASMGSAASAGLAAGVTGAAAFGNTYQQARREGFDSDSATLYAVLNGVSEAGLQYVLSGVGNLGGAGITSKLAAAAEPALKNLASKSLPKAILSAVLKQCINSAGEFEEEYLQEILDPVFRDWALGEANGFEPFTAEALYAGVLGVLSSFVMNGVELSGDVRQQIVINRNGQRFNTDMSTTALVDSCLDLPPTFDAQKSAQEYNESRDENGNVHLTTMEAGLLFQQQMQAEEIMSQIEDAVQDGQINNWDELSDDARVALVNPKNATYFAETYGLDINENMSPQEIADVVKDTISTRAKAMGDIDAYLNNETDTLTDEAKAVVENPANADMLSGLYNLPLTSDMKPKQIRKAVENLKTENSIRSNESDIHEEGILRGYSSHQIQNWDNSKIRVYRGSEDIDSVIADADAKNNLGSKLYFGAIGSSLASDIKAKIGVDVEGYNIALRPDEIIKIKRDHHGQPSDAKQGQRAVEDEDIKAIPEIIKHPDDIVDGGFYKKTNKKAIRFSKTFDTGKVVVVTLVSDSHHNLQVQTLYAFMPKTKKALPTRQMQSAPARTSITNVGTASDQNITQPGVPVNPVSLNQPVNVPQQTTGARDSMKTIDDLQLTRTPKTKLSKEERTKLVGDVKEKLQIWFTDSLASWAGVDKQIGGHRVYNSIDGVRRSAQAADSMIGMDVAGQQSFQTDILGNKIGKSLSDIWAPVYQITKTNPRFNQDFQNFLRLMDNAERAERGMSTLPSIDGEGSMSKEESQKYAGKIKDKYKDKVFTVTERVDGKKVSREVTLMELAEEVWQYNLNMLNYTHDGGLITDQELKLISDSHGHYIPAMRMTESSANTSDVLSTGKGVKRQKGEITDMPFRPVDEAMAQMTRNYVMAAKKNQAMNTLADVFERRGGKIANFVFDINAAQEEAAVDESTDIRMSDIESEFNIDNAGLTDNPGEITFYRNGKKMVMQVSDGIYEGFKSLTSNMGAKERILGAPTRSLGNFFKAFVTNYNPTFLATNFFKDFGDAIFYSSNPVQFVKNWGKNWLQIKNNGALWQLYKANGGFNSSFFETYASLSKERNVLQRFTVDKIEAANMFIEQAPRFAEFRTVLETEGVIDKHGNIDKSKLTQEVLEKAMAASAEITVNFGRSGTVTRKINRSFVPFLNASVQGATKIARQFQQRGGKAWALLATKAALFGVMPAVLNSLWFRDDDEYKHLTDWTKDNNYMFKLGDGKWLAIPRGRFMSFFAGLGNRAVQAYQGEDVDWSGMGEIIKTNIAPANPLDSNILSPIIRAIKNETFFGGKIDNSEDLSKNPEDRYDESTSAIFKWLGQQLKVSPKRLQTVFEDYTGFIGDVVVPMTDSKGTTPLDGITQKFIKDVAYSNDYGSQFSAYRDELDQLVDAEGYSEVPSVLKYKQTYLKAQSGKISEMYDEISKVQSSNLSDEEKNLKARAIRLSISAAYETTVNNAEMLEKKLEKYYKVDPNAPESIQKRQAKAAYAKAMSELVGATEGLKAFGLSDDAIKEIKAQGIDAKDYYKYYEATHTGDKYYKTDKDGKAQSYSAKEKKQILLDTIKDEKTLAKIYNLDLEYDDKKEFNTMAYATKHGVKASSYIKRELQAAEEEGDKSGEVSTNYYYDNGEIVEETTDKFISGSKLVKATHHMLNSGYTDKEIEYFYQKEYGSDDSFFVWAMQSGIDAKTYVQYREDTALITADKDENGKSISGTKKPKIFAAIDALPISRVDKLMLFARDYTLTTNQYKEVFDYINSLSLSSEEKLRLAEGLGFLVEDGKVYMKKAS